MLSWNEVERLKREAADLGRYSVSMAIVLSLVFSLAALVILSKNHLMDQLWSALAMFAVPMPIALYFRNRIVLLGVVTYVSALMAALIAAVVFGI